MGRLDRAVRGALEVANETASRLAQIKRALDQTPGIGAKWQETARRLEQRNRDILRALRGDVTLRRRNENTPESIQDRLRFVLSSQRSTLGTPTGTQRQSYAIAGEEFAEQLARLRNLVEVELKELEKALNEAGAPHTPGRLPEWKEK